MKRFTVQFEGHPDTLDSQEARDMQSAAQGFADRERAEHDEVILVGDPGGEIKPFRIAVQTIRMVYPK